MVVLASRPDIHILLGRKDEAALLRRAQIIQHLRWLGAVAQTKINRRVLACVENVVALILCVIHSELILDIFGQWMNLKR